MPFINLIINSLLALFISALAQVQPIYVSDAGTGTACTLSAPCSWDTGNSYLSPGGTLVISGTINRSVTISKSGTTLLPITIIGGKIVGSPSVQNAVLVDGSYLVIRDLE